MQAEKHQKQRGSGTKVAKKKASSGRSTKSKKKKKPKKYLKMLTVQQITVTRKFVKHAKRNMIPMMKQRKVCGLNATIVGGGITFLMLA